MSGMGRLRPFTGADSRQGRPQLLDARPPTALRYRRPAPLPPQRPRNRLFPCDTRDLSAEAALQHRPPGHQRELATLLDHGEPAARQFDRPAVDALDPLTRPYVCVVQAQLVRELAGDTGQFAAPQDAQHVGAVDGLVLLGSGKLLLDQPLPAACQRIAYFPAEAAVAGAAR